MNNVVDEVLAGAPRYNIKDNGGSSIYSNVQIDLATAVTTAGTPLNKALFDSIKDDLNSRLLIANKTTTAEAQAGTNDAKYMTAAKTKQREQYLTQTVELSSSGSATAQTLFDFSTATGTIIEISGYFYDGNGTSTNSNITLNGTSITGKSLNSYGVSTYYNPRNAKQGFYFRFDLTTKTFIGYFENRAENTSTTSTNGVLDYIVGHFSTVTTLTATLRGSTGNATITASIKQNY